MTAFAGRCGTPAGGARSEANTRTFELRIEQRRVPPAHRVLRATEGERVELRWSADEPLVNLRRLANE